MPENGANSVVRFGLFEADLLTGELRRNGSKVRLQEQPFQILKLLLQKPGEVLTREELRTNLWPAHTFVDFDHGLNAAIKRLRDALGDSAENPRFIETLARRGYRFIAPVDSRAPAPAHRPSRAYGAILAASAMVLAIGITAGWVAARKSSAALGPMERRLTGNPQNEPIWHAALSPDGKYLAFTSKGGSFLRILSSGETHAMIEPDDLQTRNMTWFPDGTRVLATRGKWPDRKPSLWSLSVLGGSPRKLTDDAERGSVSPDGTHIAFVRGDYGREELWVMDADGDHPKELIPEHGDYGSVIWSRDSRRLLFLHYVYGPALNDDAVSVEVCDPATGGTDVILSNPRLWNALALTPDNRLIYSLAEPAPNRTDSNLWVQRLDPQSYKPIGEPVRLTSGPDGKARVDLSADGKRLTYLRVAYAPQVYVAEVRPDGGHLGALHRLRLDERRNLPYDWTRDGKSLIFTSDRDGNFHLFKQALDQAVPDLLVGGDNNVYITRLDPTGTSILYLLSAAPGDLSGHVRLMRVPLSGGRSQIVLEEPGINNFQCARVRSDVCIFSQFSADRIMFYRFDSVTGQKELLKTMQEPEGFLMNWSLSPDGSTLVLAKKHRGATKADIRVLRLDGMKERTLNLDNWFAISYIDWAADGRSVWVNAADAAGTSTLLNVTLDGKITPSLAESEMVLGWAIPSTDGHRIAIWKGEQSSNAWLLEGF